MAALSRLLNRLSGQFPSEEALLPRGGRFLGHCLSFVHPFFERSGPLRSPRDPINGRLNCLLRLLQVENDFVELGNLGLDGLQDLRMQRCGDIFDDAEAVLVIDQLQDLLASCPDLPFRVLERLF